MAGRLIISLDFELMWGVRDHRSPQSYGDAVLGGRQAIPRMLALFERFGIRATWATVGLLFAKNRDEMRLYSPSTRPNYGQAALSPYPDLDKIGQDESEAPLYFGRSLVDQIVQTEGQEIASHTYGHVYALEPGMTEAAWRADLEAAQAIASQAGHTLTSIVFPRNQFSEAHVQIAKDCGMTAYRGVPRGRVYRSRAGNELSLPVRAMRFLDGAFPLLGTQTTLPPKARNGCYDVPASRFLRPWSGRWPVYSTLHQNRIMGEMTHAAQHGTDYHLWWHPHNMGRNIERNLAQLTTILEKFQELQDLHGFQSASMADVTKQEGVI